MAGFLGGLLTLIKREPELPEVEVRTWSSTAGEYPEKFSDVIGQERAVRLLRTEAEVSRRQGRPLPHVLLFGPPGVGKTMLAEVTAGEAGCEIYPVSGPEWQTQVEVLQTLDRVVELFQRTRRPVAVIVDEVDGVSRVASYALHALMTKGVVFWKGEEIYRGLPVCILATCNSLARTPAALRSRFRHSLHVDYLQPPELSEIARRAALRLGMTLSDDAAEFLGQHGGGEGRKILHLLRAAAAFGRDVTLDVAKTALDIGGLHAGGLDERQWEYLRFLSEQEGGTAGISTLAAYLACDRREIAEVVEPFLIRSRSAIVTPRGRQITPAGRAMMERSYGLG